MLNILVGINVLFLLFISAQLYHLRSDYRILGQDVERLRKYFLGNRN
jgi:hypothetical protein